MTSPTQPPRRVVIVGAGIAGLRTAETLRRHGFPGSITLLGAEPHPAYDRPALSKEIISTGRDPRETYLRPVERYRELEIELILGRRATGLDLPRRRVLLDDEDLPFDALVIATGAAPRQVPAWEAADPPFLLRTLDDAARLQSALTGVRHLTVVGAGFIGSEVAASARQRGIEVTVLELAHTPLARSVGPEMGAALMRVHRDHGTDVRLGVSIAGRAGPGSLRLTNGMLLESDLVVAGVGAVPETGWLRGSGLELGDGVMCDETLRAGPGVYAVGDVANWPNPLFGRRMRVEHWTNASQQATVVARNLMNGAAQPFSGANYVWSDQYGVRIQLAGSTTGADVRLVAGSIADRDGLAWYRSGGRLVGALAVGRPRHGLRSVSLIEARTPWDQALAELASWN